MAYVCELSTGHRVSLDNRGNQTIVTVTLEMSGQQQQTSNSMITGPWTAPPEAYQSDDGAVFKLFTSQGELCIQLQGNSVSMTTSTAAAAGKQQQLSVQQTTTSSMNMPPMEPMGMTMNPMEMRMGDMELKMDATSSNAPSNVRQFCSQCGTKVAPDDRFCSSCGHRLS